MRTYTVAVIDFLTESPAERAISVSELNRQAKMLLEQGLARVWVEGEISNLAKPASGHLYFSLKDELAQIRCAFFRQRQRGPALVPKNGDQVLAFGRVSLYEARGEFQLIVEQLEAAGAGELRRRFEALKARLAAEGLFDEARKKALPRLPARVGVVTSPTGAAIRDIITVLRRRFPAIPLVIYPTAVQGDAAAAQVAAAIRTAIRRNECDVLIVGRGGGSLEDLWPFNEEVVARAIADSPIPIVSAVGHEVDVTIADFAADVRAPTPSGAAELVVPDQADWDRQLSTVSTRIATRARRYFEDRYQALDWLSGRLSRCSPVATVARQRERLAGLRQALASTIKHDLNARARHLEAAAGRLLRHSPQVAVQRAISRLNALQQRLVNGGAKSVERLQSRLRLAARALNSVSPLATLERGYSIVSDAASGRVITSAGAVTTGQSIRATLAHGMLEARVTKMIEGDGRVERKN